VAQVLDNLASVAPGGRNAALNHAAWMLGRWVAAGALEQVDVDDGLSAAAVRNGLVADDGERHDAADADRCPGNASLATPAGESRYHRHGQPGQCSSDEYSVAAPIVGGRQRPPAGGAYSAPGTRG
jgi:hypothetical protein